MVYFCQCNDHKVAQAKNKNSVAHSMWNLPMLCILSDIKCAASENEGYSPNVGELFMFDHWKPYVAFKRSKITAKS
jgi:hypothetical protein